MGPPIIWAGSSWRQFSQSRAGQFGAVDIREEGLAVAAGVGLVSRGIKAQDSHIPSATEAGQVGLEHCFRASLLERRWGGMGAATPGIPPSGFKGFPPCSLQKAGLKE